jgi:lipid-A-disaccharide synthase
LRIGIVAGEASGDFLGARLITSLRALHPNLEVVGLGGPAMIAAGCQSLGEMELLSVMGFVEPLLRLPSLIKLRRRLLQYFLKNPPDVFIGIDSPDFNLGLEVKLKAAGIRVVHYVSPSVWAWRQSRIYKIKKAVDLMLTLFPFEVPFYEKHLIPVQHAGHPLAEQIPLYPDKLAARRALGIKEDAIYVALLPGSRQQELKHVSSVMLESAQLLLKQQPNIEFLTSHLSDKRYKQFHTAFEEIAPQLPLKFYKNRSREILTAADVVIVTAGTATLEAMLHKKPMVIIYKMTWLTHQLAKLLVKTPYIGLPNLLAGELIVPELIQEKAESQLITESVLQYIREPLKVKKVEEKFLELHQELKINSFASVVNAIF